MTSSRATLVQVAERAGVSLASTSRALHGSGASAAMVERVRAAADELGYSPDAVGRSLRMKRTFQIAFAAADIGGPAHVEMMTAIHGELAPHGYRVVVLATGDTAASTADLVHSLNSGFADGMVLVPPRTDDLLADSLRRRDAPVVVVGRASGDHGADSVSTDSAAGIGRAVRHLRETGRRRIGFLGGPADSVPGEERRRGFDAATAGGGGPPAVAEAAAEFTVAAGEVAARRLLDRAAADGGPLDAVVAADDLLAIAVLRAARERGLSVPGDLAVTGVGDTELGRIFQPSLTSVSLGWAECGRSAARIMLDLVRGRGEGARRVRVEPRLIVRESTGGAAPGAAGDPAADTPEP
ncbi:LacI family transcriptional regulator [Nocardiopsis flavescens]|uniref:LacI family transcriptional regulator n=3 Tax=Nocardiopsis flavescens TaxID=758803 RepID=A0A1M6HG08_9ACTN|nr:LacI family DNA-binding transcriptional regulator [Nocardiopsis flavescens]SHJ21127.1 LacI family transcriptional regulator [Nocardiopsis flavescens]